jgi:hypothetical protein
MTKPPPARSVGSSRAPVHVGRSAVVADSGAVADGEGTQRRGVGPAWDTNRVVAYRSSDECTGSPHERSACVAGSCEVIECRGLRGPSVASVVAALVACLVAGCGETGPSLTFPAPIHSASLGVARAHQGDRWSIGMGTTICLDAPGRVEVTAVTPVRADGLRVTGWAVRPNQNWKPTQGVRGEFLGEERAPLQHCGFKSRTVDVGCDPRTPKGYELAIRVLKTLPGPAVASGWDVSYRGSGGTGTLEIPLGLLLCPAESADAKRCNGQ